MKIAYCLLVHKNPRQVTRLLRSIQSKDDFYYVNVFNGQSETRVWRQEIGKVDSSFHVSYKYGKSWGKLAVVQATLDAMRYFSDCDYDYFINLTGQCYPLRSIDGIKKALENQTSAFMEADKFLFEGFAGPDRIETIHLKNPVRVFRDWTLNKVYRCKNFETRPFIRFRRLRSRLPYDLKPHGGSAYFCITRKHVQYILRFLKEHPKLLQFYKYSFGPDEMFFQTILANSEYRSEIVNDNLRYIDWSRRGQVAQSPALLTFSDAEKILGSRALFARKFDMYEDFEILDLIDKHRSEN